MSEADLISQFDALATHTSPGTNQWMDLIHDRRQRVAMRATNRLVVANMVLAVVAVVIALVK